MTQLNTLKILVAAESDISRFANNDALLNYALSYAESEILKRRGSDTLEEQYLGNQIEGAKWYLSRIGTEGAASISENGEQTIYKDTPDWLVGVLQKRVTVRDA